MRSTQSMGTFGDVSIASNADSREVLTASVTSNISDTSGKTIVLIGLPGAGKKTLGVFAAVALRRRFVSFERYFEQRTTISPSDYTERHGVADYRNVENDLANKLLSQTPKGSVIAGLGLMPNSRLRTTLMGLSRQCLVIYVKRARSDLMHNFNGSPEHIGRLFDASDVFYESCSAFEFYNCTESLASQNSTDVQQELLLKYAEKNFLRFLHYLLGIPQKILYSHAPLSASYTYALQIPLGWLEDWQPDYTLLECGADAVSLVIDLGSDSLHDIQERISREVSVLRRHTRSPLIIDIKWHRDRSLDYLGLLRSSLRLSPDMMTVSLTQEPDTIDAVIKSKCNTKIIGTQDQMTSWIDGWDSKNVHRVRSQAKAQGCDAMRITYNSSSIRDNFRCTSVTHDALKDSDFPVSCYNIGGLGRPSVCFNPILSPVNLAATDSSGLTLSEACRATFASFMLPKKEFLIFGQAVYHSLSPIIHNAAYEACGMPHNYRSVQSKSFEDIKLLLADEKNDGIAVSLPYKTDVIPLLHELSTDAEHIRAVNTILIERSIKNDGSPRMILKGHNTDFIGIQECAYQNLSPANAIRDGSTALIIGAGGMARAAIYACHKLGVRTICVHNRTYKHAQDLAAYYHQWIRTLPQGQLDVHVLATLNDDWPQGLRQPTVIVSCIPARQVDHRAPADFSIPERWLQSRSGGVFVELAYEPLETNLIRQMRPKRSRGWVVVDGIEVLIKQAIPQFELFTGRPAPIHIMRNAARTHSSSV